MQAKGKLALITGASSGIGLELAKIHAAQGGDLILVARSADTLNTLKAELEEAHGCKVLVLPKDLSKPRAGQEIYEELKEKQLEVHFLINNAGFGGCGLFHQREWQQDQDMIQVNITALSELCRSFLPDFVERGEGRILNVSSTASLIPGPLQAVYYATKAYVSSFSYAIAEELRSSHVTVTALLPGATDTKFAAVSGMDKTALFSKPKSAREVAQRGYSAMLRGELSVIVGLSPIQKLQFLLIPFLPKKLILKMIHKMQEPIR